MVLVDGWVKDVPANEEIWDAADAGQIHGFLTVDGLLVGSLFQDFFNVFVVLRLMTDTIVVH